MSTKATVDAFEAWRDAGDPIVMVTVTRTAGSTYSKAGHRILIAANGDYCGLVSGGCLEGDLAERANEVRSTGIPHTFEYDLRDDADELWGMGIGCNGVIEVMLQRLDAESNYEPFATIAECAHGGRAAVCSVVTASEDPDVPVGATEIKWPGDSFAWRVEKALDQDRRDTAHRSGESLVTQQDGLTILHAPVRQIPRLLILGAGPDAVPLVRMATELGWRVTIADHREAYVSNTAFDVAERRCLVTSGDAASIDNLDAFTAAVVMTHHLDSDRAWLQTLAATHIAYVGLLGPHARRDRLVADSDIAAAFGERLHGPVGLDIGADSPESIALSILAEIQLLRSSA
jgi:xanthine dehydrogenase accessory factor